jgi:hypothetical protein
VIGQAFKKPSSLKSHEQMIHNAVVDNEDSDMLVLAYEKIIEMKLDASELIL